jgi:hypothetical protein
MLHVALTRRAKGEAWEPFKKQRFSGNRGVLHRKARSLSRSYLKGSFSPLYTPEVQHIQSFQYRVLWLELRPEGILMKGRSKVTAMSGLLVVKPRVCFGRYGYLLLTHFKNSCGNCTVVYVG